MEGFIAQKKSVLIIDSSQILMEITRKLLERVGYSVKCAIGISGAKECLRDYTPDAIVLENELPDGDGIAFCRELREYCAVPVLLTSGEKGDELPALQAGASDFLKKPADYEIYKARIHAMLYAKSGLPYAPGETLPGGTASGAYAGGSGGYGNAAAGAGSAQTERPPDAGTEPARRKKAQAQQRQSEMAGLAFTAAAAACVALTVAAIGVYNMYFSGSDKITDVHTQTAVTDARSGEYIEQGGTTLIINDVPAPLAPFIGQDADAVPYIAGVPYKAGVLTEGPGYGYMQFDGIEADAGSGEASATLLNPETNACSLSFEIILQDTGDVIYKSGLVEPGMCIDKFILSETLETGEYKAAMLIRAYAAYGGDDLNYSIFAVTIRVS